MIAYHAMAGDDIRHACREAVALANEHNDAAEFDFNGVHVVVTPGEAPDAAVARWHAEFERNAEAYRNSPEGRAAKAEAERRRRQCQRETDDLIARLPNVVRDLPALVRWCASLSSCGDHIDITWGKSGVADQIEAAGWAKDAHVGKPKEAFENKQVLGEYIIGQVIACLRSGMPPHPVTQRFAKDYEAMS